MPSLYKSFMTGGYFAEKPNPTAHDIQYEEKTKRTIGEEHHGYCCSSKEALDNVACPLIPEEF